MSVEYRIVPMSEPLEKVVALQAAAFPPPFPQEFHWKPYHLRAHIELFPEGQLMAIAGDQVVGSCSNCIVSEERWKAHADWNETVGGPNLRNHDPNGTTLYGLDITVHPDFRRHGIGRAFYTARFDLVRRRGLKRYGTACRMPDYRKSGMQSVKEYADEVVAKRLTDRTLTPLLRYGMRFIEVLFEYMEDLESDNAAALLEWTP